MLNLSACPIEMDDSSVHSTKSALSVSTTRSRRSIASSSTAITTGNEKDDNYRMQKRRRLELKLIRKYDRLQ